MSIQNNKKGLGRAIQVIRESNDLTVDELSKISGVKADQVKAIEHGSKAASLLELHAMAKALNSSLLKVLEKANEFKDIPPPTDRGNK